MKDILKKIKKADLIGRGGAGFPTALKWELVEKAESNIKYLIVNGAEGEPGVFKDGYIIKNFLTEFIKGIEIAFNFIKAEKLYFYLNSKYYNSEKEKIKKAFNKTSLKGKFSIIEKPKDSGYIGGEESSILNIIEGKRAEPRIRPPFPTEKGLFSKPTLVNNVETLYNVYLVSRDEFEAKRFYSVNIEKRNKGLYFLPDDWSIKKVLKESGNYPDYDFFVQVGGDVSGEVLNEKQIDRKVGGSGSITIHSFKKHQVDKFIEYYLKFFFNNSCGQCTPCREGTYRLLELFKEHPLRKEKIEAFLDLCNALRFSSFCALGSAVPVAITSYFKNVYEKYYEKNKNKD
jgi:NADH:ubiquinone oxidoreductase subunit F (NADH-binding)